MPEADQSGPSSLPVLFYKRRGFSWKTVKSREGSQKEQLLHKNAGGMPPYGPKRDSFTPRGRKKEKKKNKIKVPLLIKPRPRGKTGSLRQRNGNRAALRNGNKRALLPQSIRNLAPWENKYLEKNSTQTYEVLNDEDLRGFWSSWDRWRESTYRCRKWGQEEC